MRYVIAMSTAIIAAALAALYVSSPFANAVVRQFTFDNPDSVASLHAGAYMACNVTALVLGFLLGWAAGSRFKTT